METSKITRADFLRMSSVAGAAALLAACAPSGSSEADVAALRSLVTSGYQGSVNSHDVAAYVNLYADDVLWAPPNAPDATSKAAIQSALQGLFDKFEFEVEITPDEIEVMGDLGYVLGHVNGILTPRSGDPDIPIRFTILWLMKKLEDDWKIYRQVWNNTPAPA